MMTLTYFYSTFANDFIDLLNHLVTFLALKNCTKNLLSFSNENVSLLDLNGFSIENSEPIALNGAIANLAVVLNAFPTPAFTALNPFETELANDEIPDDKSLNGEAIAENALAVIPLTTFEILTNGEANELSRDFPNDFNNLPNEVSNPTNDNVETLCDIAPNYELI